MVYKEFVNDLFTDSRMHHTLALRVLCVCGRARLRLVGPASTAAGRMRVLGVNERGCSGQGPPTSSVYLELVVREEQVWARN